MTGRQLGLISANYGVMQKSFNGMDAELLDALRLAVRRCVGKEKDHDRSASCAFSRSGERYVGARIGSETNIITLTSEHVALVQSTVAQDYGVERVVTMVEDIRDAVPSPLVAKILIDYVSRTQGVIAYEIVSMDGDVFFSIDDVRKLVPLYAPEPIVLARMKEASVQKPMRCGVDVDDIATLRACAIAGIERNFPLYDSASGYGAAVLTAQGDVYYAGQYSSPDKRLGTHAEMNALLGALMAGTTDIVRIGVVSSKFTHAPCQMCGVCRQFLAEMCARWGLNPMIHCFASETDGAMMWRLKEYLPATWTSKTNL